MEGIMTIDRKPLSRAGREPEPALPPMESMEPHSIRYTPTDWRRVVVVARRRGEEPSRFARKLTMYALSIVEAQDAAPAHGGLTAFGRL